MTNMTTRMKNEILSPRNQRKYQALWGKKGFKWADSVYDPKQFMDRVTTLLRAMGLK